MTSNPQPKIDPLPIDPKEIIMIDTTHTEALTELHDALRDLPNGLHAWVVALADTRDEHARAGRHKIARVWQAFAVLAAEIEDAERDVLRGLDFDPGITIRPLTADELADDVDDAPSPTC